GVLHHDAADIAEVAVPPVAPARELDRVETLGHQHVGEPYRVSGPGPDRGHERNPLESVCVASGQTSLVVGSRGPQKLRWFAECRSAVQPGMMSHTPYLSCGKSRRNVPRSNPVLTAR